MVEKSCEKARVKRILADKAYDSYENFEFLHGNRSRYSVRKAIDILIHPRSEEARKQKDSEKWKEEKGY